MYGSKDGNLKTGKKAIIINHVEVMMAYTGGFSRSSEKGLGFFCLDYIYAPRRRPWSLNIFLAL